MSSSATRPPGDQVRQMIAKLSADEIARLIPQEKMKELLKAQNEGDKARKLVVLPNPSAVSANRKKKVNAFMAFRSYYSGIFQDRPQKQRSPLLTLLWQADPFKPKWTMMANVYSRVRDFAGGAAAASGGRPAMMGAFLRVAGPIMGVTRPCDYLGAFGWEFARPDNNIPELPSYVLLDPVLRQVAVPVVPEEEEEDDDDDGPAVPMTELDLLRACMQGGFLFENSGDLLKEMEGSSLSIMAQSVPSCVTTTTTTRKPQDEFFNKVISNPAHAIAVLLPPDQDLADFIVDFNVVSSFDLYQQQDHHRSEPSMPPPLVPVSDAVLFAELAAAIDPARMAPFPPGQDETTCTPCAYLDPNLGVW